MSAPRDESDDELRQLQSVEEEWAQLRQQELNLVKILQARASAEEEKAPQLEAAGDLVAAEQARSNEQKYLREAQDALRNEEGMSAQ